MRFAVLTIVALLTVFAPAYANDGATSNVTAPKVTAMMYYADWCGPCQMLKPVLEEAAASYEAADVDVMYLDFTSMDFENLARQADKAESIGMADHVPLTGIRTGYAELVIDGEVRGRISAGMDVDLIHMMLDAALVK